MSTICIFANTLYYPTIGGHRWVYLNWALGVKAVGSRVIWMEGVYPDTSTAEVLSLIQNLKDQLGRYGLADALAICSWTGEPLAEGWTDGCLSLAAAAEQADLLLNLGYELAPQVVGRFRRSTFVDVDPGLSQIWIHKGQMKVAKHDCYATTGETVGTSKARFPDLGVTWHHIPPCVALDWWPLRRVTRAEPAFTTLSQWYSDEWVEEPGGFYCNNKREGFLPFLELPRHTSQPLELALSLGEGDAEDLLSLQRCGWRVREADAVAYTPLDYQCYIQGSLGEFSCAKPSCVRLQNAWISDRTVCYLASGKPAVVQHTGPSRFLPDADGLFRFRDLAEAARCLDTAAADYDHQCRQARALAEEYFDAKKNLTSLLERVL